MQLVSQAVSRRFLPSGDMVPVSSDNWFHLAGIIKHFSYKSTNYKALNGFLPTNMPEEP